MRHIFTGFLWAILIASIMVICSFIRCGAFILDVIQIFPGLCNTWLMQNVP
jgi:hypothetical protein